MKEGKTLNDILKTHIFNIPEYQRGYAWKERQLEDMWDDINDIKINDGEIQYHYTGMLCLAPKSLPEEQRWTKRQMFDVVDGQQRLTTIMILLSQLLYSGDEYIGETSAKTLIEDFICKKSDKSKSLCLFFQYPETNKNHICLKKILTNNSKLNDDSDDNVYKNNLIFAKDFFENKIKDLSEDDKSVLFDKVTSGLLFDYRVVDSSLDVQMVFETMNNRGKSLSTLEKLKNRLIYLQSENSELCKDINRQWGAIYQYLGIDEQLSENRLIADHLSVYRQAKYTVFSESEAEEKVFEAFSKHPEKYKLGQTEDSIETKCNEEKISEYINGLACFSKHWCSLTNTTDENIIRCLYLSTTSEIKIFISVVLMIADQDKDNGKNQAEIIFKLLHNILFRNRIPGAFVMDERALVTRARDMYSTLYENDIKIRSIDNPNSSCVTYDSLDAIIKDFQSQIASRPLAIESFKSYCSSMFDYVRGNIGFYRWGDTIKYILVLYEFSLPNNKDNDKISWKKLREHSIEHILPQDDSNWPGVVSKYQIFTHSADDSDRAKKAKNILINTLGNLAVIPGGKNSSLGNAEWIIKKNKYSTGALNEQEIARESKWEFPEIFKRGQKIIDFLLHYLDYNIPLTTEDYKTILLRDSTFYYDYDK